mmetsp:Transcript_67425/g.113146  ORF Transcript_67425/g.113146 Transcript_67425/m.113146 type:complete len:125 (+) Transcript_67425:589-963(+)
MSRSKTMPRCLWPDRSFALAGMAVGFDKGLDYMQGMMEREGAADAGLRLGTGQLRHSAVNPSVGAAVDNACEEWGTTLNAQFHARYTPHCKLQMSNGEGSGATSHVQLWREAQQKVLECNDPGG